MWKVKVNVRVGGCASGGDDERCEGSGGVGGGGRVQRHGGKELTPHRVGRHRVGVRRTSVMTQKVSRGEMEMVFEVCCLTHAKKNQNYYIINNYINTVVSIH